MVTQRSAKPFTWVRVPLRPPKYMYYVYTLKCNNNDLYIGSCKDLKTRIGQHINGMVISTKGKRPVNLIYYEAYSSKVHALKREKRLKEHKPKSDLKKQIGMI